MFMTANATIIEIPSVIWFCLSDETSFPATVFVYNFKTVSLFMYIAMVDGLTSKTIAWEKEKGIEFTYDGVSTFFKKLVS